MHFVSGNVCATIDPVIILAYRLENIGAACVTRTRDPVITNDVLYRLS